MPIISDEEPEVSRVKRLDDFPGLMVLGSMVPAATETATWANNSPEVCRRYTLLALAILLIRRRLWA
ncbi:hypothetical protein KQX54_015370 [Cotesia glomerata]|uniref:Uncharacterized protein n=1 Tax=Cotesia glomerata TaxID=32391 RepID=A0AAV7INE9_COTGL|nr:hypothetical protein KQX54_015370 [Cotesia glomerata]